MPSVFGFCLLLVGALYDFVCSLLSFILPRKLKPIRSFSDDIVLVTGAAHGLGRCLSIDFARRGGTLVLWDINESGLESVRREIERDFPNVEVFTYVCNVALKGEVYSTAEKVKQEVGNVSVLVNNAGIVSGKSLLDERDEELERSTAVNYMAHTWTAKAFLPWMLENDYGYIVNIVSILSQLPLAGATSYCASKSSAWMLCESLKYELRAMEKNGITVSCVCPYLIRTGMFHGLDPSFQWLLPTLTPEYVAERTLQAITDRQFLVLTPRLLYFLLVLAWVLPERTIWRLNRFLGFDTIMKSFEGHLKKD